MEDSLRERLLTLKNVWSYPRKGRGTLHAGSLRYAKIPWWHRRGPVKGTGGIHETGHWQKTRFMGKEPGFGLEHEVSEVCLQYAEG